SLLEKDIGERRPAYRDYVQRTPAFSPAGRARGSEFTPEDIAMQRRTVAIAVAAGVAGVVLGACASAGQRPLAPLALAADDDLDRFMGDWYVIAAIATAVERNAHHP